MAKNDAPEQLIFLDGLARSGTSFTARLIGSFPGLFLALDGLRIATEVLADIGYLRLGVREYPAAMFDGASIDLNRAVENLPQLIARIRAETDKSSRNVQGALPQQVHRGLHHYLDTLQGRVDIPYRDFFLGLFSALADSAGVRRVGTKTTNQAPYMKDILSVFPQAKWISIIRDPRGNYLSQIREHRVPSYCFAIDLWNAHVRHTLDALSDASLKERVLLLRYEDLMLNPLDSTHRLALFLGIDLDVKEHLRGLRFNREDGKTWYHNSSFIGSQIAGSDGWDRSDQPLYAYFDPRPVHRWQQLLGKREQQVIAALSGTLMRHVGYVPSAVSSSVALSSRMQWLGWRARRKARPYLPRTLRQAVEKCLSARIPA